MPKKSNEEEDYQSDIRHDLRNKLQIIEGYLSLLEDADLPEEPKKYIEKSMKATRDASKLLEKWKKIQYDKEESK